MYNNHHHNNYYDIRRISKMFINNDNINYNNVIYYKNYNKSILCEFLFSAFLPNLYSNILFNGYDGMYDFLNRFNNSFTYYSNLNARQQALNGHCINCNVIYSYALDLANHFNICYQIESNLLYFDWLMNLFKPLTYALFSLFLLPSVVVIFLYASSLFLFLYKHWKKLKVSCTLLFISI